MTRDNIWSHKITGIRRDFIDYMGFKKITREYTSLKNIIYDLILDYRGSYNITRNYTRWPRITKYYRDYIRLHIRLYNITIDYKIL